MEITSILSAIRRSKIGAILIGTQIALTLAIVSNSLSIIEQRIGRMQRPTGIDEANIFVANVRWIDNPPDLKGQIQKDVGALRGLPGVIDVSATNSYPLQNSGMSSPIMTAPDQRQSDTRAALYISGERALSAWGMQLVGGRWFASNEISEFRPSNIQIPGVVVVTRELGNALFASGNALGKNVYFAPGIGSRIVGIVDRAQTPWAGAGWASSFAEYSMFIPSDFVDGSISYVVRVQPRQLEAVLREAERLLPEISRTRVVESVRPFKSSREQSYRSDRSLSLTLTTVCALLLLITALGIVGLTSYWVAQRRRQIGVRRALGAMRSDIVRYFQMENLIITVTGGLLGIVLGVAANTWLVTSLEMTRMKLGYLFAGAFVVLVLGQLAALWPALRAASTSPAIAARGL